LKPGRSALPAATSVARPDQMTQPSPSRGRPPSLHPIGVTTPSMFTMQSKPTEILNQAGQWLAQQLGSEFRWVKSRQAVSRTRGSRTDEIRLQPSKWNRAGSGTWATLRVTVRNKDLGLWRRSHPSETLLAHDPDLL